MYLSNRLTFSIFSVLLVAAFVIVPTAMAQTTVTAYQEITAATTDAGEIIVITLTYSDTPDPRPDFSHFTAADNAISEPDDDEDPIERDVLAASYNDGTNDIAVAIGGTGKTVTLTFTGPAGDGTNVGADINLPAALRLKGYGTGVTEQNLNDATDRATDPTGSLTLTISDGYIGGKSHVVYVRGTSPTAAAYPAPVLPTSLTGSDGLVIDDSAESATATANSQLVRTIVADSSTATENNSNMAMPDLEEFFNVGGGTIDLVVEGVGERDVVINEIMWGVDNSRVGQTGYTSQQWIEVYNRKTTPAAAPSFTFTNGDGASYAPAAGDNVVDRITNIAGVQNVWNNPRIKGSNGTATRAAGATLGTEGDINGANPAFTSVYRSNYGAGDNAGHWTASTRPYFPGFLGTPGVANTRGGFPGTRPDPSVYTPPKDKVIINEVGNYANDAHDWIELRNVTNAAQSINGWRLNRTDGSARTEHNVFHFPNVSIPAGEVLLFVNAYPADHPELAAGTDITLSGANQQRGAGPHKYRKVSGLNIPDMSAGLLILRSHGDNKYRGGRGHLHDAVGPSRVTYNTIQSGEKEPEAGNTYWKTDAWPINGHSGNNYRAHNAGGSNNGNASLAPGANFANGTVWARSGTAHGWRKGGGGHVGFVGGLGYQRGIMGKGTPGYHNDVVKNTKSEISGSLIISELMLTTDDGRYPQWIELHNTSKTHGIDTADTDGGGPKKDWKIRIENHNSGKWQAAATDKTVVEFNLKDLFRYIPPNQTVLIVSDKARNSATATKVHFPNHRVKSIWDLKRGDFLMDNRRDIFLNAEGGFYIKITDGAGGISDEIGNLDGKAADIRNNVEYDNAFGWSWLGGSLEDAMGKTLSDTLTGRNERTSLIRLKNADNTHRAGTPIRSVPAVEDDPETEADESMPAVEANETRGAVVPLGTPEHMFPMDAAWVHAVDTKMARAQTTYYGVDTDHGTPGHTANTPLPVELSFFRPTLEDGQVTIQWTTESELDNAGFNILRSDSRSGEFKQVNEQMIQGKGTTATRSAYKWVDTTAKPGAVYYYQIEDVSFAGEHNTLATTKLKGLISAKGKLTTSWGDIKDASQ